MRNGFKIGRNFGIAIDIDWSWLLIVFLIAWNLSTAFAVLHPEWSDGFAWDIALLAAFLFFGPVAGCAGEQFGRITAPT